MSGFRKPPRVLAIAGSDSSGGAGIQADIKTITMLGGYAMTAITAVTAQNTLGVSRITMLSPVMVAAQISACVDDIGVDAVKIGMLGSPEIAEAVADSLEGLGIPIVFDPVMVASSGAELSDDATVAVFERLIKQASLSTPNAYEFHRLGGVEAWKARKVPFMLTGGDEDSDVITDLLEVPGGQMRIWEADRIPTRHTHGTGCTLSSAIATFLAAGHPLGESAERARQFVRAALHAAPGFGAGHGPLGHAAVRS
jgi:hydroxymethylpyrimidine/phosphomethylpyrimidine kinase